MRGGGSGDAEFSTVVVIFIDDACDDNVMLPNALSSNVIKLKSKVSSNRQITFVSFLQTSSSL